MTGLDRWFDQGLAEFDAALERLLAGCTAHPRLAAAVRHGVLAGGKRLRPYLVIESARLMGIVGDAPLRVAAALECIHCFSLIHDDLPAMDDDAMRRGKPTVHIAFDQATAILAGDALNTYAFELLADAATPLAPAVRLRLVHALAQATGGHGMIGGQMLDLAAEGRFEPNAPPLTVAAILRLQRGKTGALIAFGATAGALMQPDVDDEALRQLRAYGDALGLAFQIRDDLIDVEVDAATAGKATGKDGGKNKGTFVSLLGADGARARLEAETATGISALSGFGPAADPLRAVLTFNSSRVT